MKKYMITGLAVLLTIAAQAQTTMDEVLRQVETNNRELQAARQYYEVQLLESKSENNLPDPSVSYSHQYGNRAEMYRVSWSRRSRSSFPRFTGNAAN